MIPVALVPGVGALGRAGGGPVPSVGAPLLTGHPSLLMTL
jgi:hypothetical protein